MTVYTDPVFEEPETPRRRTKYHQVLEPLKEHPGKWAAIGEYKSDQSAYQASLNLRHGKYKYDGDPSEWEFTSENCKVYAMYVGPKASYDPLPLPFPSPPQAISTDISGVTVRSSI